MRSMRHFPSISSQRTRIEDRSLNQFPTHQNQRQIRSDLERKMCFTPPPHLSTLQQRGIHGRNSSVPDWITPQLEYPVPYLNIFSKVAIPKKPKKPTSHFCESQPTKRKIRKAIKKNQTRNPKFEQRTNRALESPAHVTVCWVVLSIFLNIACTDQFLPCQPLMKANNAAEIFQVSDYGVPSVP